MSSPRTVSGLFALSVAVGAPAAAHDTWLLPLRFALPVGASVDAGLTSGMRFPEPESAVASDRLAATGLRVGGRIVSLEASAAGAAALRLSAMAHAPGVAVVWATTRPRTLSLTPVQVREYLGEIGADKAVEARWRRQRRWRETYSKIAKAYVRVGDAAGDRSWEQPVGLELEIVPLDDPTTLRPGRPFRLRVLRGGRPLAGFPLSAVAAGRHHSPILRRTAADGTVAFEAGPSGPWLLRGTLLEASDGPDADWQSLFTTLTVGVGPPPSP
jgi:hypothetical protein